MPEGVSAQTAWNRTMLDASSSAQRLVEANNGATVSEEALAVATQQTTLSAKASQVALKGLSIAGNMLAGMLIGMAVSAFVGWIDDMAHAAERAKETAEEFSSSFEDMQKTHRDNTSTIAELSDEYKKLSQGVNALGDNVSLGTDEYNRYHEITNKVADLMPDLVQGWDAEGNAILKVKGHLADLNEEYRKTKQNEARKTYYSKDDDDNYKIDSVFDDYNNDVEKFQKDLLTPQSLLRYKNVEEFYNGVGVDAVTGFAKKYADVEIDNSWMSLTEDQFKLLQKNAALDVKRIQNELNTKQSEITEAMTNYATTTNDYWKLDDNKKTQFSSFFNNLSTDFINDNLADENGKVSKTRTEKFVNDTIAALSANKNGINDAFNELFELDLETINPEETKEKIDELLTTICETLGIDNTDDKGVKQLKLSLGFDTVDADAAKFRAKRKNFYWQEKDVSGHTKQEGIDRNTQVDNWIADKNVTTDELEKLEKDGYGATTSIDTLTKALQKYRKEISDKSTSSANKLSAQKSKIEKLRKEYQDVLNQSDGKTDTSSIDAILNKIDKAKSKLAELKSQEFINAWSALENTDNDELKDAKKDLTDLADAGKLTVDEFKCIPGVEDYFKEIGLSAEEAVKKINDLTDNTKQLSTLKSAIGSIQDAYSEKKENGIVGADTLSKMEAEFSSAGKAWDTYKQKAGSAKTSTAELKKAQNELATAYVNSNNFLSGLVDETGKCTDANKQYYISQLEELGIKNAEEVVNNAIIQQKANLALANENLASKTEEERIALVNETIQLAGNNTELQQYIYYKALASNSALSTSASVQNLITLANQCGIAKSEIQDLQRLLSALNQVDYNNKLLNDPNLDDHAKMQIRSQTDQINNTIGYLQGKVGKNAKTNTKAKINFGNVNVNPTKNGAGSGSGSKSSSSKQEIDWIDRKVTVLNSKISLLKSQFENLFTLKKKNTNLNKQISQTTKLINTYSKAYSKYMAKANSVKISKNKKTDVSLKSKVRNGQIKGKYKDLIKEYGEKTADKISKYQDWYDKAQSAKQSKTEAKTQKHELKRQKVNLKITDYNNKLARSKTKADNYQYNLDLQEANGRPKASKNYTNLIKNADKQKSNLKAQNKELTKYRKTLKKNSEEWYEIQQQIDDNKASMKDLTLNQVEWNNAIQDMKLDKFRNLSDLLDGIKSKFQALISLNEAQGYTESDADIAKEIKMGNVQISNNKGLIKQQWDNLLEDATKKKSDKTGFGWGLSKKNANKFKSSYQKFLNGGIDKKQFEKDLKTIGLTWNQVINNSELQEGIKNILDLETENLNIMTVQEQKYDELAQKRIDAMNDYIDKLKEANDQKSKAIELEKLQQKLQAAKQNKSIMIYHEGYGFNYEEDRNAVNEAQSALDDAQFDAFMDKLSKVVDLIQKGIDNGNFNLYDKDGKSLGDVDALVKKYLSSISKELAGTFSDLEFYEDNKGKVMVRQKGVAYANGVVNAPKDSRSLVAEAGDEILVRDGQWNLLKGAQFIDTKPGDIIFNHEQTKKLLKDGHIGSSGKAFNEGTGNYESWRLINPLEELSLVDRFKNNSALIDSMLASSSQIYMQNMERQLKGLQASLNMVQPRNVEQNKIIHINTVELQGVNDVQTLMRDLDHLASTINSDANQRAWKH